MPQEGWADLRDMRQVIAAKDRTIGNIMVNSLTRH